MPIIFIALAAFVFWPRYDLSITYNEQGDRYIAEESLLTLDSCRDAYSKRGGLYYVCMKWSKWSEWTNDYTKYDSKHG